MFVAVVACVCPLDDLETFLVIESSSPLTKRQLAELRAFAEIITAELAAHKLMIDHGLVVRALRDNASEVKLLQSSCKDLQRSFEASTVAVQVLRQLAVFSPCSAFYPDVFWAQHEHSRSGDPNMT